MSSSSQEPRVSGKPDAMFSFDSEPTLNTFSVRNRSNEPGDQFESSVLLFLDLLTHQMLEDLFLKAIKIICLIWQGLNL